MTSKRFKKVYVIILIAILFVVSAGASLSLLKKSQELLSWNERASGRAIVQLVLLQQSYLSLLIQLENSKTVNEQLITAYDLVWSAYDHLIVGSNSAYFVSDEHRLSILNECFSQFKESDPLNVELSGEKLTTAIIEMQQAYDASVKLLNQEFQGVSQQTHMRDFELVRLNKIMIIGLLGLTVSGGLFLIIIVRERRHMTYRAYHDPLTKIGNRSALKEKIAELQKDNIEFCALLIDVDRFKAINDTFGHDVGDKLLIFITEKMSTLCGELDFVGRLGGDEFAILYLDKHSVENFALKLLDITKNTIKIDGYECDIGFSIGISCSKAQHTAWVDIVKEADHAMYQAKENGGAQYQGYNLKGHS